MRRSSTARCWRHGACGAGAPRGARARALVREGARSRAIAALTTEVATLSPADQRAWAAALLPGSQNPPDALSRPVAAQPDAEAAEQGDRRSAMQGVHFAALSAPGPSGSLP